MNSEGEQQASDRPLDEEAFYWTGEQKLMDQIQQQFFAQPDDGVDSIYESEDLEALSDEDAGDYSLCTSSEHLTQAHDMFDQNYQAPNEVYCDIPFEVQQPEIIVHPSDPESQSDIETEPQMPLLDQVFVSPVLQEPTPKEQTDKRKPKPKPQEKQDKQKTQPKKPAANQRKKDEIGTSVSNCKVVDLLIIGGGPASLGFIINAVKNGNFHDLTTGDGLAILDAGLSFGGGNLCNYGINSNTSANGFVKCILRKVHKDAAMSNEKGKPYGPVTDPAMQRLLAANKAYSKSKVANKSNLTSEKKPQPTAAMLPNNMPTQAKVPLGNKSTNDNETDTSVFKSKKGQKKQTAKKPAAAPKLTAGQLQKPSTAPEVREEPQVEPPEQAAEYDEDIYNDPAQAMAKEPLTCFRELVNSSIVTVMRQFGPQVVPLSLVGHLLNYVGNHVLYGAYVLCKQRIFYPMHKAVNIQLMGNGEIVTTVQKTEFHIVKNGQEMQVVEGKQSLVYFRSKALIMAGGASQSFHPSIFKWFPSLQADKSRLISSDSFLKKWMFTEQVSRLRHLQSEGKKLNIVIVGGSHSGLSCAWMLLNGPSLFGTNSLGITTPNGKLPGAIRKVFLNCQFCCICPTEEGDSTKNKKKAQCGCICKCFGFFKYDDWSITRENLSLPVIEESGIKILYRDNIKVFFKTGLDAIKAGYHDFDKESHKSKDGYVYSFTGLRGDAKNLYLRVKNGQEKRVEFVKAKTPEEQRVHVDQADLVIWACGYQSEAIPIHENNKLVKYSQTVANTQFDVDGKCRIKLDDGSVLTKCYACGVGFPVRTKDGVSGIKGEPTNPRADSFSLYMNTVGAILIKNILPKKRNAAITQQREFPAPVTETDLKKSQLFAKKKKILASPNLVAASLLSAPNFKSDEHLKAKAVTQKHVPAKLYGQVPQTIHVSPKEVLAGTMLQRPAIPVVLDNVGEGLSDPFIKKLETKYHEYDGSHYVQIADDPSDLNERASVNFGAVHEHKSAIVYTANNSRSMERRPRKNDALGLLNDVKRKHVRGLSHNRPEHLIYSDFAARRMKDIGGRMQAHNQILKMAEGGGEVKSQLYDGINYNTHLASKAINNTHDERPKEKLSLPDIREHIKDIKNIKHTRGHPDVNTKERSNIRKNNQYLTGKSPQLLQMKQHDWNANDTRLTPLQKQSKFLRQQPRAHDPYSGVEMQNSNVEEPQIVATGDLVPTEDENHRKPERFEGKVKHTPLRNQAAKLTPIPSQGFTQENDTQGQRTNAVNSVMNVNEFINVEMRQVASQSELPPIQTRLSQKHHKITVPIRKQIQANPALSANFTKSKESGDQGARQKELNLNQKEEPTPGKRKTIGTTKRATAPIITDQTYLNEPRTLENPCMSESTPKPIRATEKQKLSSVHQSLQHVGVALKSHEKHTTQLRLQSPQLGQGRTLKGKKGMDKPAVMLSREEIVQLLVSKSPKVNRDMKEEKPMSSRGQKSAGNLKSHLTGVSPRKKGSARAKNTDKVDKAQIERQKLHDRIELKFEQARTKLESARHHREKEHRKAPEDKHAQGQELLTKRKSILEAVIDSVRVGPLGAEADLATEKTDKQE